VGDDSQVIDIASAVAEGTAIDWHKAEEAARDESERAVVRELQVLAKMSDAMRTPQMTPPTATPTIAQPLHIGDHWGHLRISGVIGEGSFGSAYKAWDTRLECDVALKLLKGAGISDEFDEARALKEARLLARVNHRNVVRVYGAESHAGRVGIWMELIRGRSLEQLLAGHGPMGMSEGIPIGIDLCHALAAVHGAGLLHRDIKAHNVLREEGGRIVLMDFGTGRHIGTRELTDSLAGTPLYMAPELFAGARPSVAADIYSAGVLLYHLVTADYPVRGSSCADIESAHTAGRRQALRDLRPDLPSAFINVVERSLARNPKERYRSAGEFGNALAAVGGVRYSDDSSGTPLMRRMAQLVAAVVIAAALLAGVSLFNRRSTDGTTAVPEESAMTAGPALTGTVGKPSAPIGTSYEVVASFYAFRDGREEPLAHGSRVRKGDKLFAVVEASQPVFVYIVNRDDAGESFLLFPLPGFSPAVSAEQPGRLPGLRNGEQHYWDVTSAGGREHFFVYVTPHRLVEFEQLLQALPRAELGHTVSNVPLSPSAVGLLRGVGGLSTAPGAASAAATELFDLQPLSGARQVTSGVWARRVTFDNPAQ
jgi:hypothetical protein